MKIIACMLSMSCKKCDDFFDVNERVRWFWKCLSTTCVVHGVDPGQPKWQSYIIACMLSMSMIFMSMRIYCVSYWMHFPRSVHLYHKKCQCSSENQSYIISCMLSMSCKECMIKESKNIQCNLNWSSCYLCSIVKYYSVWAFVTSSILERYISKLSRSIRAYEG